MLAGKKGERFNAQGYCMYPLIHPGDLLHIEPRTVGEIAVGDIAVFRRNGQLLGHRTIEKREVQGVPCIVTRSDSATRGDDGPTSDERVLGIITAIERNGRKIDPAKREYSRLQRKITALKLSMIDLRYRLMQEAGTLSRHRWYRFLLHRWLALRSSRLQTTVQVPFADKWTTGIVHRVPANDFDAETIDRGEGKSGSWRLVMGFARSGKPAGQATFAHRSPACPYGEGWILEEVQVRQRYRGSGLEERLVQEGEAILRRSGMQLDRHPFREAQD